MPQQMILQYVILFLLSSKLYLNLFCRFLNPNYFFHLNDNCSNLLDMRNLQEEVKKHSVTKNCSDLSLFE